MRRLLQSCPRATHNERQSQHGPGEELHWNLENDEMGFLAPVVLGKSVNKCEEKRLRKDAASKAQARTQLHLSQSYVWQETGQGCVLRKWEWDVWVL